MKREADTLHTTPAELVDELEQEGQSEQMKFERGCNGGNVPPYPRCGKPATVVVSAFVHGREHRPLQWYACDDPEHHRHEETSDVETTLVDDWLKQNRLPPR